jgi:hypothetical protein
MEAGASDREVARRFRVSRMPANRWRRALARITEAVRRWFGVEYTLAGMDLLLHRIGWSVQVPARRAAGRDEAAIAAWREEAWPVAKDGGGPGRLDRLRRRVWPGLKAAGRPHLGTPRHYPGGEGDRRQQQAHLPGRAHRDQTRMPSPADLPRAQEPPPQRPAQRGHRDRLRPAAGAAHQQLAGPIVVVWDNLNSHVSTAMAELAAARDWLTVCQLPPYATSSTRSSRCGRTSGNLWPIWPNATSPNWARW